MKTKDIIDQKLDISNISLVEEEDMQTGGGKKRYDIRPVSKEEKAAFKNVRLKLLEKGLLEDYESGTTTGPHGFLIHHFRHLRTQDGKVLGLRSEGGEVYTYDPPVQHEGQQKTTCSDCGKEVLLHTDFQHGDVSEKNGAYCVDCTKGRQERWIPITFIDLELRFKVVYKPNKGAMLTTGTKPGIMRSYCGDVWIEKDRPEFGDSFILLMPIEDSSDIFTNNHIFVKIIKGPIICSIEELLKDFIPSMEQETINTMMLKCETCDLLCKLSNEELDDVSDFIIKHKLYGTDFLSYMELAKGRSCKNSATHKFKFEAEYEKVLYDTVKKNEDFIKERDESLTKKDEFDKERDNILTEQINKMRARDELAKKMEEITKEMSLLTIRMDGLTKNIDIESKKTTDYNEKIQKIKERLYQLTKISDFEFWPERKKDR